MARTPPPQRPQRWTATDRTTSCESWSSPASETGFNGDGPRVTGVVCARPRDCRFPGKRACHLVLRPGRLVSLRRILCVGRCFRRGNGPPRGTVPEPRRAGTAPAAVDPRFWKHAGGAPDQSLEQNLEQSLEQSLERNVSGRKRAQRKGAGREPGQKGPEHGWSDAVDLCACTPGTLLGTPSGAAHCVRRPRSRTYWNPVEPSRNGSRNRTRTEHRTELRNPLP